MPQYITVCYRTIPAVRKHIEPQEALPRAGIAVGVEEAAQGGVIISALEVIEARLLIQVVAVGTKMRSNWLSKQQLYGS